MKRSEQQTLSPRLLFTLITLSIIGFGLLHLPLITVEAMGNNAYWAIFLSLPLVFLIIFIAVDLHKRFPGQSIIHYSEKIIGKPLAYFFNILLLLEIFALLTLFTREIGNILIANLVERTPLYITISIILIIVVYLNWKGLESLGRLASFFPSL